MLLRILDHLAFDFGYLLPQMYSNYFSINNPFIRYRENLCYQVRNSNWALICHFIFSGLFFVLSVMTIPLKIKFIEKGKEFNTKYLEKGQ